MSLFQESVGDGVDAADLEERARSGGMVPEGRFKATLFGAKSITSKEKQTPGWELKFKISEGPFAGSEVTDTLYITDHAKSKDRINLFAARLGGLVKDANGKYVPVEGKNDFIDLLDNPCVIHVVHESGKRDDGTEWHSARLAYCGVYRLDDPEAFGKPEKAGDKPKGGGSNGTAAATSTRRPSAPPNDAGARVDAAEEKKKLAMAEL